LLWLLVPRGSVKLVDHLIGLVFQLLQAPLDRVQ
jgi:hypothetical protein